MYRSNLDILCNICYILYACGYRKIPIIGDRNSQEETYNFYNYKFPLCAT